MYSVMMDLLLRCLVSVRGWCYCAAMKELCQDVQCGDGFTVALSG